MTIPPRALPKDPQIPTDRSAPGQPAGHGGDHQGAQALRYCDGDAMEGGKWSTLVYPEFMGV